MERGIAAAMTRHNRPPTTTVRPEFQTIDSKGGMLRRARKRSFQVPQNVWEVSFIEAVLFSGIRPIEREIEIALDLPIPGGLDLAGSAEPVEQILPGRLRRYG
jgi:hypothetical protein